jgi:type I restriction enzyme S subunit
MGFEVGIPIDQITDGTPITYGVVKPGPEDGSGVKFIRGGDVVGGKIRVKELRTITHDVSAQYRRTLLKGGELLVSLVGNPGEVAVVPAELSGCNIARQVGLIRIDTSKFNPWFVQYYLMSPLGKAQLFAYSMGSVQKVINLKELKRVEIPDVPLGVQNKIVKHLRDLDDKIELNRQTNQTLEAIAQAMFKSWFVDFKPTRAKIKAVEDGQDPTRAAMAAIAGKTIDQLDTLSADQIKSLTTTAALFPDALASSDLGAIPEGWIIEKLSDEIDVLNGFAFKSKDYSFEGTFVLRTKNFNKKNGTDRLHDDVFLPEKFLISHKKYLSKAYDYHLIMVGASVGNRGIIYPCHLPALRNQNMWCFRAKESSIVTQPFAKYLLDTLVGSSSGLASGSAREFFRKGDFGDQIVCIGGTHIQDAFFQYAMPLLEKMAALTDENQNLEALRDTLLPKLLSGEIELSEVP